MKTFLLSVVSLFLFFIAQSQSADEIIAKHIDAIGGKEKLSQITSVYQEQSTQVMGNEGSSTVNILIGKGYKTEINFNGQILVQVITDKGGWAINPFTGATSATAISEDQYKSSEDIIYFPDPLFNYAAHGATVELLGQEKVGDVNAYKLKYLNKDSVASILFIDPNTNYVIKETKTGEMQGQQVEMTYTYSDYKKTDFGVFVPFLINVDMGQFSISTTIKKVEFNKPIDPSIFDMPK